jgi:hypothetical protein
MVHTTEHACLPQHVRCQYHQQGPCCSYSSSNAPLYMIREGQFVQCVFTSIKQRVCFSFHALPERFWRWIKPPTTAFLLGTFADLTAQISTGDAQSRMKGNRDCLSKYVRD